jgi:hypothetical protein
MLDFEVMLIFLAPFARDRPFGKVQMCQAFLHEIAHVERGSSVLSPVPSQHGPPVVPP